MLSNLQALRAVAALNVVLFHIIGTSASYNLATFYISILNGWGANGVDLFFVISGFVLIYSQKHNPKPPAKFLKNRVIRIVPTYWLFTLFLAGAILIAPSLFRELKFDFQHIILSLFFISNLTEYQLPLLHVGWTLECEMLFYSILAISLCLKNNSQSILFTIVVLLILVSLNIYNSIVLEFIFGMAVAILYTKNLIKISYPAASCLLLIGICLLSLSIAAEAEINTNRVIIWGIPSFIIVLALCYMPQTKNSLLILLGNASYSIYLIQVFTIPSFYKLIVRIMAQQTLALNNDILALVCLIFTVTAGVIFYLTIEKSITQLFKNSFSPKLFIRKTMKSVIRSS